MLERGVDSEPERARRTLCGGVLVFRWVAFGWMAALNLWRVEPFRRPALAWFGIVAAGAWTLWLTAARRDPTERERPVVLGFDLALSSTLILISGLVVPQRHVTGPELF